MPAVPLRETLSGTLENLLLFSVFFVALPHAFNLATPVFLFFAAMLAWRYAAGVRPALKPNQAVLFLLMLAGAALVYFQYHRVYGRDGGSALFLVGLGLKAMEMKTRREIYLVVYLSLFVALTQYLFSETIPMVLYTLAAVGLTVSVLIGANSGTAIPLGQLLRRAGAMVAQAVPVMVVLFVFFPRIPGPLWRMPDDGSAPKTGLSDTMEPGSVSRLSESSEPAFRVDFEGDPPPPAQRYWRGPVFWRTNGVRWSAAPELPARKPLGLELSGPAYRYTITIEPHQRRWVFALDLPARIPGDLEQTKDFLLLAKDKLNERRQYTLVSQPEFRTGPLDPDEAKRGLQLPDQPSARVGELVAGWQADGAPPRAIVDRALKHFRAEQFFYTLNPPSLPDNPIERFLFETRKGFCEHYATAFVYLMRVAGVPARIVTGYQGGQWNPLGKFLEVRQADAHAWAEVWLPETGWTRIDPTAAVAPERIEQGLDLDSQAAAGEVRFNVESGLLADQAFGLGAWLQEARLLWSSIDHAWNQWVLAYSPENQRRFWEALGIVDWRSLLAWLGGLLALGGMAAAWLFWPRRPVAADPAVKAYRRFLKKLARRGTVKRPGEGPLDFAGRAAAEQPRLQADIHRITGTFLSIQYGKDSPPGELARLKRMVGEFRV
jgi:transglutaminase-like putative cysteine protease